MAWTYDSSSLGTSTAAERLNAVRLLIGDTDENDPKVQNEEITFALAQTSDNVYNAAAWVAGILASKYSHLVTIELDGALRAEYSDLARNYRDLKQQLKDQAKENSAGALGVEAGGISITEINAARDDTDRPQPSFRTDQFQNPKAKSTVEDYTYDND